MTATIVKNETIAKIEMLLKSANGKRRERVIPMTSVISCIRDVVGGSPFSFDHAGSVANAYTQAAVTTLVIAARVDGRFFLGIGLASAKGKPTPGRAFRELQPFGEGGPRGNAEAKWSEWTTNESVIELAGAEIDALIETGAIEG